MDRLTHQGVPWRRAFRACPFENASLSDNAPNHHIKGNSVMDFHKRYHNYPRKMRNSLRELAGVCSIRHLRLEPLEQRMLLRQRCLGLPVNRCYRFSEEKHPPTSWCSGEKIRSLTDTLGFRMLPSTYPFHLHHGRSTFNTMRKHR